MRYRDWKSADLDRARRAVRAWRDEHPQEIADQLIADIAAQFHPDYGVVLRGILFAVDRNQQVTGIVTGPGRARLSGDRRGALMAAQAGMTAGERTIACRHCGTPDPDPASQCISEFAGGYRDPRADRGYRRGACQAP
jgi:hypothetical protein